MAGAHRLEICGMRALSQLHTSLLAPIRGSGICRAHNCLLLPFAMHTRE